jgi:cytoskeletal protein CcmA (bactofilin family)/anti-sigma factor RsiW
MNHFDEMNALLYLEGQLDAEHVQEISSHARECAECRELLRALQSEGAWLRESLAAQDEPVPARLLAPPERGSMPWGWITALGLAAGGAYTVWFGFVEPWRAQAAEAGFTQGNVLTMLFFSGAFWKGWDAMRSLSEFAAVATLGIVTMWLVRRRWRRATTVAFVLATLFAALALPPASSAGETYHGDPNYTLAAGQEVKTDLIVAADDVRIDGDVDGDLIVVSEYVTVTGRVKGDIIAFARDLRVNGPVDGNVRAFCQSVELNGTVAKNVMAWTEHLRIDSKALVGGSLMVGTNLGELNGKVGGDVMAFAKDVEVEGALGRNFKMEGERLRIGSGAAIEGTTKFWGRRPAEVSPTAKLGAPVEFVLRKRGPDYATPRYYWHRVLGWGASFVFGLAILLIAPAFFYDVASACKRVGPSAGLGVLFLLATPIAAILVCFTLVALPVGISTLLLWIISLYSAQVFVGAWVGEKILGTGAGVGAMIGRLALGLAIIRALSMLPYLGGLVMSLVVIWGLGALALTIYKRLRPQLTAAAA